MSHIRSLAAAQTVPAAGDVEANVEQHLQLVHLAADEGARLLVFPELSLTGYELRLASDLAFSEADPRLNTLADAAAACSMTLVVGAPVRIGPRLYIGAFILSPDQTLEIYTKHRLGAFSESASVDGSVPPAEANFFHPGDRNPLIQLGGNTAAVAVCADTGRESHAQAAAERGANTYLASMFVIPSSFEQENANLEAYAVRFGMAVVFANYGGATGGLAAAGRSAIWSERGELLARLDAGGTGVVIARESPDGWHAKAVMLGGGRHRG